MLNQESLSILNSLIISGVGLLVVVAELAILAIGIKLFTGALSLLEKKQPTAQPDCPGPLPGADATEAADAEDLAVVLSVMHAELSADGMAYRIVSVTEI